MSTAPNFNRLAHLYRWMEYASFGPWLWWCRCAFLRDLRLARYALVLGDGDGRFTAQLLRRNPELEIQAIDGSAAMLRALVRRAGPDAARVQMQCADLRAWQPDAHARYDLFVTHFFLDCLTTEECAALAMKLRCAASEDALWVVSEFAIPGRGAQQQLAQRLAQRLVRTVARALVAALYRAFGWLTGLSVRTLPDHESALRSAGFVLQKRRDWLGGLLTSQLWTLSAPTYPPEQPHRPRTKAL